MNIYEEFTTYLKTIRNRLKIEIDNSSNPGMLIEQLQPVRAEAKELARELDESISKYQR